VPDHTTLDAARKTRADGFRAALAAIAAIHDTPTVPALSADDERTAANLVDHFGLTVDEARRALALTAAARPLAFLRLAAAGAAITAWVLGQSDPEAARAEAPRAALPSALIDARKDDAR